MSPEEVEFIKKLPPFFHPKPVEETLMIKFSIKLPGGKQKNYEMEKSKTTIFDIRAELQKLYDHRDNSGIEFLDPNEMRLIYKSAKPLEDE